MPYKERNLRPEWLQVSRVKDGNPGKSFEILGVQREHGADAVCKHGRREPRVVSALARDIVGGDQREPMREDRGCIVQQRKLRAEICDSSLGLAGCPAETV